MGAGTITIDVISSQGCDPTYSNFMTLNGQLERRRTRKCAAHRHFEQTKRRSVAASPDGRMVLTLIFFFYFHARSILKRLWHKKTDKDLITIYSVKPEMIFDCGPGLQHQIFPWYPVSGASILYKKDRSYVKVTVICICDRTRCCSKHVVKAGPHTMMCLAWQAHCKLVCRQILTYLR